MTMDKPWRHQIGHNNWDFDPKDNEMVWTFLNLIKAKLTEEEERMLLCLVESEEGLAALLDGLY
jgi:hypothetical protein